MNERIKELAEQAGMVKFPPSIETELQKNILFGDGQIEKFAELIVRECINREQLLGAIARGWCSEKNSHKTMDPDLALAIFDEVERQIKQQFGVKE
jgi:hypothetical protein